MFKSSRNRVLIDHIIQICCNVNIVLVEKFHDRIYKITKDVRRKIGPEANCAKLVSLAPVKETHIFFEGWMERNMEESITEINLDGIII